MDKIEQIVNIVGAGLAGLFAAKTLSENGCVVRLISVQPSERAQSNLAEGGINASLDVMGECDTVFEHFEDTMHGGCDLADPNMVMGLVTAAPKIIRMMDRLGVPFHCENGKIIQRNFGGQKKKRTAYAKSSTGKVLMAALIDEVRKQEVKGRVIRFPHHRFECLLLNGDTCTGVQVFDIYEKKSLCMDGYVIMACGGFHGMFSNMTTGTTANTGSAAAVLFSQGVRFGNLEFIQYHPTTVSITGKRLLVSEAARGEGGRLFFERDDNSRCYFMEEKFGERGNLMPRDVVSREMANTGKQIYLDLTILPEDTWKHKLSDLREEIIHYLAIDPKTEPIPVAPGIHYFMGGIYVDASHKSNLEGLYAAGECACAYHGANRLGGNSLLGAIYGGWVAAESVRKAIITQGEECVAQTLFGQHPFSFRQEEERDVEIQMEQILFKGLGMKRDAAGLQGALDELKSINTSGMSEELCARYIFAEAMIKCALERKESRGAHTRLDYPKQSEAYRKITVAVYSEGNIDVSFEEIPVLSDLKMKNRERI